MSVKIATPTKDDIFRTVSADLSDSAFSVHNSKTVTELRESAVTKAVNVDSKINSSSMGRVVQSEQRINLSSTKKRRSLDKSLSGQKPQRKRSYRHDRPKHGKEVIKLPTKFLLGGNINDPLNLNSMNDEAVNKILNAETPVSSPLPTPAHRKQVEVIIPPNINDPLNLNSGEDVNLDIFANKKASAKKRKKHKRKKSLAGDALTDGTNVNDHEFDGSKDFDKPLSIDVSENSKEVPECATSLSAKLKKVVDKIVSPAIPQHSPKPKRKRTISEGSKKIEGDGVTASKHPRKEEGHRMRKQSSYSSVKTRQDKPKFRNGDDKFIYGNYDRYYGKRNPQQEDDKRLNHFQSTWFHGKDVLDIGCNIGHITLSIAKDFEPRKIVGMDIDGKLISIARKNVKHYLSKDEMQGKKVPVSLPLTYGPLATMSLPEGSARPSFPDNISFVQGNYVLERDELLDLQKEEYDVIMGLSITKWIHLNFGDAGIKRMFKRIYRQLRPGGKFILEPQSYASYKRKKKLTEAIFENYKSIELRPERFTKYLLSAEVGFSKCDRIETPHNKSEGFQRPIYVYTKPCKSQTTPTALSDSRGVTPLMNIECHHSYTPAFESSTYATPNYDSYNFALEYNRTPSRQFTPLWEGQSRSNTPTESSAGHASTNIDTKLYTTSETRRSDTPTYSTAQTPTQTSVVESHPSGLFSDTHTSGLFSSEHVHQDTAPSSGKTTPGHMTPSCSQTSSSTCDTCCSECSENSCHGNCADSMDLVDADVRRISSDPGSDVITNSNEEQLSADGFIPFEETKETDKTETRP